MSSVAGARSLLSSSDETFTNVCAPCKYGGTQREATHYCKSCQELLCASCTEAHKGMKISRNHDLVSVENISKPLGKSSVHFCAVLCECGQNVTVVEYCEYHKDVLCQACKTLKHRQCKTVAIDVKSKHYTAENLALIAQKVRLINKEIDELRKERNTGLQKITTMTEQCKKEIKSFRNELNAFFDLLEQNSLKELETIETRERNETERQLSTLSTAKQMLHTDDVLLQDARKSSEKSDMFSADVKISNHLKDYEALLKDIRQEMKSPVVEFKRHKELTDMKAKLTSLGTLTSSHETDAKPKRKSFLNLKIDTPSNSQVDIRLQDDKETPWISGCDVMSNNQVLLCDHNNKSIKMLSSNLTMKDHLDLPYWPCKVSVINNSSAIITLPDSMQLQYIELAPRLKTGLVLQLDKKCWGVAVAGQEIYVTCHNNNKDNPEGEVRCLDMYGNLIRRLEVREDGSLMFCWPYNLTVNTVSGKIFVSDYWAHTVACLKSDGSIVYQYKDPDLREPGGICVDDEDNIIVCCRNSNTVHLVTAAGKKRQLLRADADGIQQPDSVAYRHTDGTLIIGCCNSNKLFMYKMAA